MTEGVIDKLPVKSYLKNPREQLGFVGGKPAIRLLDPKDRIDMQRYRRIQDVLGPEFTDIDSTDKELIQEVRDNRPGKEHSPEAVYTFGVSGLHEVPYDEVGEIQGWINVYKDDYVPQLIEQGMLPQTADENMILNIAFARHPDAKTGQMASGLQQVCTYLSRIEAFQQKDTPKTAPELIITAYAENPKSEQVLTEAGFKKNEKNEGKISLTYPETNETFNYMLYTLDWQELNNVMHRNADTEILVSRKNH